jgi:hypothetical protein
MQSRAVASPVQSIRQYCLNCSNQNLKEVRECVISDCPLYPFRQGQNPNRRGVKKGFKAC